MTQLQLSIGTLSFKGPDAARKALEASAAAGVREVDTAQLYGTNEADIGNAKVGDLNLTISSKSFGGFGDGDALKPEILYRGAHESLQKIGVKQLDIFYIHAPDRKETGKLEKWVPTIDKLHKEGVFRRFGISNFSEQEVIDLYDFSKKNNYVLPSVYQGNYNPLSRGYDATLFPLLRERKIVFYAYSPIAGGYLAKSKEQVLSGVDAGRFDTNNTTGVGTIYKKLYHKDSFNNALGTWGELAEAEGITRAELAYRWVYYHSALKPDQGDNVILGASRVEQIASTVDGLKRGPLKAETAKAIDGIWEAVKHDVEFVNNFEIKY